MNPEYFNIQKLGRNTRDTLVGAGKTLGQLGLSGLYGLGKASSVIGGYTGDQRAGNWIMDQASQNFGRLDNITRPYSESWHGKAGQLLGGAVPITRGAMTLRSALNAIPKRNVIRKIAPKPVIPQRTIQNGMITKRNPIPQNKIVPHPSYEAYVKSRGGTLPGISRNQKFVAGGWKNNKN